MTALSRIAMLPLVAGVAGCDENSEARAPVPVAHSAPRSSIDVDPLPSWNDGSAKAALVAFVERVTKAGSPDFVPPRERIAVFDNDGTLWCEQPIYVAVRLRARSREALAAEHPEWKDAAAVQGGPRRRPEGARRERREAASSSSSPRRTPA